MLSFLRSVGNATLFCVITGVTLASVVHAAHTQNEVIVKFRTEKPVVGIRDTSDIADFENVRKTLDIDRTRVIGGVGAVLLHSRTVDTLTLVKMLKGRSDVIYAHPNYIVVRDATPGDPLFANQWGLQNTGQSITGRDYFSGQAGDTTWTGRFGADIHAPSAWDIRTSSGTIAIAIIDSGIDYNHADLNGSVWSAPADYTFSIGSDAQGHPYNFTCPRLSRGVRISEPDPLNHQLAPQVTCDGMDQEFHGTHVAGIAGAVGNNTIVITGVNWSTILIPVSADATVSSHADAINYIVQLKTSGTADVRIISASWHFNTMSADGPIDAGLVPSVLLQAMQNAKNAGILFVASAGNDNVRLDPQNNSYYPVAWEYDSSGLDNIVSVAASNMSDGLWSDLSGNPPRASNYGDSIDLAAPGEHILSTLPRSKSGDPGVLGGTSGSPYGYLSGTSMATPFVSGTAALVWATCPSMTYSQVKSALLNNVDNLGLDVKFHGRLNASAAIGAARQICAPASLSISPSSVVFDAAGQYGSGSVTSNTNWTLSSSVPWISLFQPSSGVNNASFTYAVSANNPDYGAPRTGTITAAQPGSVLSASTQVTQKRTNTTFSDVPKESPSFDVINLLYRRNITTGCLASPLIYCPSRAATRAEAAVFVIRALYPPPYPGGDNFSYSPYPYFADVPYGDPFFPFIQKMYELGFTSGCYVDPTTYTSYYCPGSDMQNYMAAVFTVRARQLRAQGWINNNMSAVFYPPGYNVNSYYMYPYFGDVNYSDAAYQWVQKVKELNAIPPVTTCPAGYFCSTGAVTREQLAYYVIRGILGDLNN